MRFPVPTVLGLVVYSLFALPAAAAQTPRAAWEERVSLLLEVSAKVPMCAVMDYTFDSAGARAAFMKEIADAPKSGVTAAEAEAFAITRMQATRAEVAAYAEHFDDPDRDAAFRALNDAFSEGGPVCKRLAEASPYVKPGPFQASGRPQTLESYLLYRADTGSADDIMRAQGFYETGYFPDPDYTKRIALARRAAEKRDPKAAMFMVSYYISGEGVEKSFETSLMWAIIGSTLGDSASTDVIPDIKDKLTAVQIARAEADAQAWLKAH